MNQEEIKTDIETEKLYLEDCETTVKVVREHLAALEAKLAEAEKPELRHGDYGIDEDNGSFVVVDQSGLFGTPKAFFENGSGMVEADKNMSSDLRLGNIYKCIAALKEPLKEFRVCNLNIKVNGCGNIQLESDDKRILYITSGQWHEFLAKFQRLVFTAEQEAAH